MKNQFSHGMITMLDSILRRSINNQSVQYPLSDALNSSAKLKAVLVAKRYQQGELVEFRKLTKSEIEQLKLPLTWMN